MDFLYGLRIYTFLMLVDSSWGAWRSWDLHSKMNPSVVFPFDHDAEEQDMRVEQSENY